MRAAVIQFPGSNCDRDMAVAIRNITGAETKLVWHRTAELPDGLDLIAIPGGFSYGDYLRCGAIAARSPVMRAVKTAERRLWETETTKTYTGLAGEPAFNTALGTMILGPVLAEFQARHPAIQIQLQLYEQLPDLAAEGFDGAVWLWSPRPQRARCARPEHDPDR